MYSPLKSLVVRLLRVPSSAPEPPAGGYASVQVFRASPRYVTYRLILFYIGCVFGLGLLSVTLVGTLLAGKYIGTAVVAFVAAILFAIAFMNWFAVRIDYDLRHYIVTDRSMRVREGVWTVQEMTLTYANVQNLRIVQGPLQRMFGISDLLVDTAGGGATGGKKHEEGGHQVRLAGIDNAREVRDLVLGYVRRFNRGSGLGDLDDAEHGPVTSETARAATARLISALRDVHAEAVRLRQSTST